MKEFVCLCRNIEALGVRAIITEQFTEILRFLIYPEYLNGPAYGTLNKIIRLKCLVNVAPPGIHFESALRENNITYF